MLLVVSPAKNLDFDSELTTDKFSQPQFLEHSQQLVDICKQLSPVEISSLMKISDKLAGLNAARFGQWQTPFTVENARPAAFAFNGDVYTGLDAQSLTAESLDFAQQHLKILSGLYGVLKPLDLMQAYRLEMGTKLTNNRGENLYKFWGALIAKELNRCALEQNTDTLINLASNEYFKAVDKKTLTPKVITPHFKDWKNGQYKIISFFAKKARGLMARYIIDNRITTAENIKLFDIDGYHFNQDLSKGYDWVFTRQIAD